MSIRRGRTSAIPSAQFANLLRCLVAALCQCVPALRRQALPGRAGPLRPIFGIAKSSRSHRISETIVASLAIFLAVGAWYATDRRGRQEATHNEWKGLGKILPGEANTTKSTLSALIA